MENDVVDLVTCTYGYQSEMILEALREAGIPAMTRGPEVGVFGYGFGGPALMGITISVPADRLEEAREVLEEHPRL